jgi:hypothetical protein
MHVLAVVTPPAPAAQSLGVASGVNAPLSTFSFDDMLSSCPPRLQIAIIYHKTKNGTVP